MPAEGHILPSPSPTVAAPNAIDEAGKWFWNFLKTELTPYPGRLWVVGRVTMAATIVMLLVMTFQLPGGFLGAIFTLFLSRENPTATFRAGWKTVAGFLCATAYTAFGVRLLLDDPMTHFLWVALSLFLSFYFLRIVADVGMGVAFGFMVSGAISLWDETTINVNARLENTLWLAGVVALGVVVTVVVEYVFRRVHPVTDLEEGFEERLKTIETVLRCAAADQPLDDKTEKRLMLYASVGTSRLRRLIVRSEFSVHFKAQMSTAIALVGRMVDIAASFRLALAERTEPIEETDRQRVLRLAEQVSVVCRELMQKQLPTRIPRPLHEQPSNLPFLPTMERTVALIPDAFAGSQSVQQFVTSPLEEPHREHFFTADAFTNPGHLQFALRGTLAAMVCYMTYTAIDWPGLSTAVATCFITALSTIGSSRQKQILRLGGAIIGGIVFGMGAQVFVLPHLDTVAGFTLLFAVVTAISAWIGTASARLSYLGVQLALAFFLINLQEFTIQTSLSIARDRVFGVLLGLVSMWLFFDRLWVRNALDEMQAVFAHNLEMFAELAEQLLEPDQNKAIRRVRQLRDQINDGFGAVKAQADAILFEFGPERQRKLQIREDLRRWQPPIRTLLLVQITAVQYLAQKPLTELPEPIAEVGIAFEEDVARVMRAMASEVTGKSVEAVPDIRMSATRVQQEIQKYYQGLGVPVAAQASDVVGLAESLATILGPLYEDIRETYAANHRGANALVGGNPQLQPKQA
jgi:multidrug resistance protein MdtO